jgi:hypothetical protein
MEMSRVDPTRSIFRLIDCDLQIFRAGQYGLQQRRMRYHAMLFLAYSRICLKHAQDSYRRESDTYEIQSLCHLMFSGR